MHLALKAYLELLHNLALMERSKDHKIQQSAKVLKGEQPWFSQATKYSNACIPSHLQVADNFNHPF